MMQADGLWFGSRFIPAICGGADGAAILDPPAGGTPAGGAPAGGAPPASSGDPPAAAPEWLTSLELPAERAALKGDKTLARYKSLPEALAAIPEQMKTIGELQGSKFPGPDAKPEERRAFWTKLGVPENVDGYKDVKVPEGANLSPDGLKLFYEQVGLKTGYTPAQAQAAVNFYTEWHAQQSRAAVDMWINGQEAIRAERGLNYDRDVTLAKRTVQQSFAEAGKGSESAARDVKGFLDLLQATGLHEHPGFVRREMWLARLMAEDQLVPGHPEGVNTEAEADREIATALQEWQKASPGTPQYATLRDRYETLLKARHGTQEVGSGAR